MLSASARILITGVTSIHGWPLFRALSESLSGENLLGIRSPKMRVPSGANVFPCCITDEKKLSGVRDRFRPTHVIHCAGVCDLDVCEERPQWAQMLNTVGSGIIGKIFGDRSHIIYLSSDLIFSGLHTPMEGYCESCEPDPLTVAGKTILSAETALLNRCTRLTLMRLGLPVGASLTGDKGAIDFIESRLRRGLRVTLFTDEWRSCIAFSDIAEAVMKVIEGEICGLFHCGGPVKRSLHEIGTIVLRRGKYDQKLLKGILRIEESSGPPRMGDVSLNSEKLEKTIGIGLRDPFCL